MAARVTQTVIEVLERTFSKARVTQTVIEVLERTFSKARVTQTVIEVLEKSTTTTTTTSTTTHFWEEDFSGMTVGVAPTGWSEDWSTTPDATVEKVGRDKSLALDITANTLYAVTNDAMVSQDDIEVLALVQAKDDFATYAGGICARVSGGAGSENGYVLFMDPATNRIVLRRCSGGVTNTLDYSEIAIADGSWFWIRMRVQGGNIKVRIWSRQDAEPGTWDIDYTDPSPLSSGSAGVCCYNADTYCDYFAAESMSADWPIPVPAGYGDYTTSSTTSTTSTTTTSTTTTATTTTGTTTTVEHTPDDDVYIDETAPTTNRGALVSLIVKGYSGFKRNTLLRLDLGFLPANAIIDSVSITFTNVNSGAWTQAILLQVYECLRAWVELEATWSIYATGSSWGTAGCNNSTTDYDGAVLLSSLNVSVDPGAGGKVILPSTQNFVDYVQDNIGGELNIVVRTSTAANTGIEFRSVDYGTEADRPVVDIHYHLGPEVTTTTTTTTSTTSTTTTQEADQFWTDFGEYTPDAAPDDDFTEIWEVPVTVILVRDTVGQYGGQSLQIDHSTFGHYYAAWDEIPSARDVDILAKFKMIDAYPVDEQDYFRIVCRETTGNTPKNAYELRVYPYNGVARMYKMVNSVATQIGPDKKFSPLSTGWWWARFRCWGNSLSFRLWQGNPTDEPATWSLTRSDSTHYTKGALGVGSYNGDYTYVDYLAVGTGGLVAPSPANWNTTTTTTTTTTSTTTTGTTESLMEAPWYTTLGVAQVTT